MTETNEQLKAEFGAIATHVSGMDRRIQALENGVCTLQGHVAELVHAPTGQAATVEPSSPATVCPERDPQSRTDGERIADLRRELAGARSALQRQRQITDDRTDERDTAVRELECLRLDLKERAESPAEDRAARTGHSNSEEGAPQS